MGCLMNTVLPRRAGHRLDGLHGSITALATPFRSGRVDEEAFAFLCHRQIERGTAALVPCGTTGEASTLGHHEQLRVIQLAVTAAAGRVPVIAGAGSNCTQTAVQLVREAERLGADAVLSVVPYYNRPSQDGLYQHFKAIQGASGLPVVLYDVPSRTGAGLALETIERLADLPNVVGLKDASGDVERARTLRRRLPGDFLLLCGDDARVAEYLALGAQGCISVVCNVAPALCAALHRAWRADERLLFHERLLLVGLLSDALFVESNPIPVKWALARLGLMSGDLRLPLTPLSRHHEPTVSQALDVVVDIEAAEAMQAVAASPCGLLV